MFLQTSFTTEYLSETNLVLTQEDFGGKLSSIIEPIKNYIQKDQDLLTFSLSRYSGGDTRISFFCQWLVFTNYIKNNSSRLTSETETFLRNKTPEYLKGLPNINDKIYDLAKNVYLPVQLELFESKLYSMAGDIITKYPNLQKYLNRGYLSKFSANEVNIKSYFFENNFNFNDFIKLEGSRISFLEVGFPVLTGLMFAYNQENNPINPQAIKWNDIETILEIISTLHQTGNSIELELMMYYSTLNQLQKFEWLQKNKLEIREILLKDQKLIDESKKVRINLHQKGTVILDELRLPEKDVTMLKELLDWAISINFVG
jgi:hypothetical protein